MADANFLELRLGDLLDEIAERTPAPGGGSVAAIAVAMAAGLVEMAARFSDGHWDDAPGIAAQAGILRERAAPLAQADAEAYLRALEAFRLPKADRSAERDAAIGRALEQAASVPLEIAAVAADVAIVASGLAERGNPNLRGDAASAAALAAAAGRAAANLVAINLGAGPEDPRVARARSYATAAQEAADRAFAQDGAG